jgi:DNA-binding winged helix-turn-helix (wHTH) protein
MQISIITVSTEFYDLLTLQNIFKDVNFVQYKNIYQYEEADIKSDILVVDNNIEGNFEKHNMSIIIGKDIPIPYSLNDLFTLIYKNLSSDKEYDVCGCKFFYLKKTIEYKGNVTDLTEKEADIIMALLKVAPAGLDKKDLLNIVWGYGKNLDTHTLETHIYRLRKKISSSLELPADIVLTDKNGYKINSK